MTELSHELWMKSVIGKDLSPSEARELYLVSRREELTKDEFLFKEGDDAVSFSLIVDGEIDIEKRSGDVIVNIATLGAGTIVGEMSLLTQEKRSAAGRVKSDRATLLTISWKDFQQLMNENRASALKLVFALASVLAYRLKQINLKVADLTVNGGKNGAESLEEFARFKAKLFRDWSF